MGWGGKSKDALIRLDWYPADYLSDRKTMSLTLEEHGAFMLLLWMEWLDGPLPADPELVRRLLRADCDTFARIWPVVSTMFELDERGWSNPRMERERTVALSVVREKRLAGKKGGLAKAKRDKANAVASATPVSRQNFVLCHDPQQQQQQQQQQHLIEIPPPPSGSGLTPEDLADLWAEHCPTLRQPDRPLADGVRQTIATALKRQRKRDWPATFARIGASPKLRGEEFDWQCPGILWAVGPKNLSALDAGQHDPKANHVRRPSVPDPPRAGPPTPDVDTLGLEDRRTPEEKEACRVAREAMLRKFGGLVRVAE